MRPPPGGLLLFGETLAFGKTLLFEDLGPPAPKQSQFNWPAGDRAETAAARAIVEAGIAVADRRRIAGIFELNRASDSSGICDGEAAK
jgi:hypothetical protein